jgi:hypothetical protein
MKYIAFIVLGLVLLAAIAGVVLWANVPTPKVTIQAIRPTGQLATRTNLLGETFRGSVWVFAITNVGQANAYWRAGVPGRTLDCHVDFFSITVGDMKVGVLAPGQGIITNMIVPIDGYTAWCGYVDSFTVATGLQTHLEKLARKVPSLGRSYATRSSCVYYEPTWRTVTNVEVQETSATNAP